MVVESSATPIPTDFSMLHPGNYGYDAGGGIYCGGSSPSLENVTVSDNTTSHYGGGIYLISNSNPISQIIISGNNLLVILLKVVESIALILIQVLQMLLSVEIILRSMVVEFIVITPI